MCGVKRNMTTGKAHFDDKNRPGNFKVGGVENAVNFTVRAVPDSLLQEGAFKTLHESGALMGSLIQVEPSEAVEIEGQRWFCMRCTR